MFKGIINVTINTAKDLELPNNKYATVNPYIKIILGDREMDRTTTKAGENYPRWDETFGTGDTINADKIKFVAMHETDDDQDDIILGEYEYVIPNLRRNQNLQLIKNLKPKGGIEVLVTLKPRLDKGNQEKRRQAFKIKQYHHRGHAFQFVRTLGAQCQHCKNFMVSGHACTRCEIKAHKHHINLLLFPCPASNEDAAVNLPHKFGPKYKTYNPNAACQYCGSLLLFSSTIQCNKCKKVFHERHLKENKIIPNCGFATTEVERILAELNIQPSTSREPNSNVTRELPPFRQETSVDVDDWFRDLIQQSDVLNTPNIPTLDDLEILNFLGRGAFGKVLQVKLKNDKIDRTFALKAMSKSEIFMAGDENTIKMEKYVLSLGNQSNFLTGLHSAFQNDTHLFFLMEYISGGDLIYHIETRTNFPESHAKFYAVELALAVIYLHEQGIIHRDLKPDNVLLDHEGHVKLADFGLCKPGIKDGGRTETPCGTPGYIAPEVIQGESYGTSCDWWSYGVILYEMITSYPPFDHQDDDILFKMIIKEEPRYPGTQTMSKPAKEMIKRLLKKDPNERLASQDGNFNDIKNEEFFKDVKWDIYENRIVTPPFVPRKDTLNIDESMKSEPPRLSESAKPGYDDSADPFNGFDFYNTNFDI